MFADAALAARIDIAEARSCMAIAEAARATRAGSGVTIAPLGRGFAIYAGAGSPVNKVIGVALDEALDIGQLTHIERDWHARHPDRRTTA